MVKAMVDIDEHANRVLNVVKAKFSLQDKSQAINLMAMQYEEEILEPEFKPEFIEKLKKIEKEKPIRVKNFAKHLGLED
ncbi:MAG: DUF2683 family protein [Candidatus Aenigmatarchaeota archaeon]